MSNHTDSYREYIIEESGKSWELPRTSVSIQNIVEAIVIFSGECGYERRWAFSVNCLMTSFWVYSSSSFSRVI